MSNKNIKSARLELREITWQDLDYIHHLHSQPEVDEYNTLGIPRDLEETKKVIRPIIENQKSRVRKIYGWLIFKKREIRKWEWPE